MRLQNIPKRIMVLGGPGCGKTTKLLDMVAERLSNGVPPHRIAFVSFTTKATDEAAQRAGERFRFDRRGLPHFRTIHSLAYRGAGINQGMVMQRADWRTLAESLGISYSGRADLAEGAGGSSAEADGMMSIVDFAKSAEIDLEEAWRRADSAIQWFALKRFADSLAAYKHQAGKIDFADMLIRYADHGDPVDVDVAIIDEAQDLSPAQWRVAERAFATAGEVIIAGDDDQAIHEWNGAQVDDFLDFEGDRVELPVSYRLSRQVHDIGREIALRIKHRIVKTWDPADHPGLVEWMPAVDALDLKKGSWMILARNKVFLREAEEAVKRQGWLYSTVYGSSVTSDHIAAIRAWERLRNGKPATGRDAEAMVRHINGNELAFPDEVVQADMPPFPWHLAWFDALKGIHLLKREYYRAALRRGEKITSKPRIYLGTIHSVKGGEADHVALMLDMTARTYAHYQRNPDEEHRVFYVGATRARQSLSLIPASGEFAYEL